MCQYCFSKKGEMSHRWRSEGLTGTSCGNPRCLGSIRIDIEHNPYVQPPFPDKKERRRIAEERKKKINLKRKLAKSYNHC